MTHIPIVDVVPGLVVDQDVKDRNGRLIIAQGVKLEEKHVRILKTWGVDKIAVQSADEKANNRVTDKSSPAYIEAVKMVRRRFRFNSAGHPLIGLLKELAVQKKLTKL